MDDEDGRLAALTRLQVLDTAPEDTYDAVAALAAEVCAAPMAFISFIDADRLWFKARAGMDDVAESMARTSSICQHTIADDALFVVPDTFADERFADLPMVRQQPHARFYAGAPLRTADGHAVGTLCVLDTEPRTLTDEQTRALSILADQLMEQLDLRRQAVELEDEVAARIEAQSAAQMDRRFLDGVLAHTDVLVYAKDLGGRFVLVNAALENVLALPQQMLGRSDEDLFGAEIAEGFVVNDRLIARTREHQFFDEDLTHADGSLHHYRSTKFPLVDERGEVYAVAGVSTDVTELVLARAAHAEAEQRWQALVENSPVAVAVLDEGGRFLYANQRADDLCRAPGKPLSSTSLSELVEPDVAPDVEQYLRRVVAHDSAAPVGRWQLPRADGPARTVELTAVAISYRGQPAIQAELRDITDQAAADQAIRDSEAQLAAVAAIARSVQSDQDPRTLIVESVRRLTSATTAELIERGPDGLLHVTAADGTDSAGRTLATDATSARAWDTTEAIVTSSLTADEVEAHGLPPGSRSAAWQPVMIRGAVDAVLVVAWDRPNDSLSVSAERAISVIADETANALQAGRLHEELARSASTDPLTGSLNRRAWDMELAEALDEARASGAALTIALIDLDHFKAYNDTFGHSAGDVLLREFADAARACLRRDDIFARWGGEEFILALPHSSLGQSEPVLNRLRLSVPEQRTCSIGYTTWQNDEPVTKAVARADAALYDAKHSGRNRIAAR